MINFRALTIDDFEDFRNVALGAWIFTYKDIYTREYIKNFINNNYSEEALVQAINWSNHNNGFNYLAVADDSAIGFITIGRSDDSWKLFRMYLLPEYIGKGIGSHLLQLGEDHIKANKGKKYSLTVHKNNDLGKNFYFKKGFKHISEKDEDDEWYLEKDLEIDK